MNDDQRCLFQEFADGIVNRSDFSDPINDAIVAASQELDLLTCQRDELLEACAALLEAWDGYEMLAALDISISKQTRAAIASVTDAI